MRKPSDHLFRFVRGMSPAEKRYYKTHYGSSQNKLTELFNFINKMEVYDEDLIRKHFKEDKLSKNLKVYKNLLFELLMKAMISYQSGKDPKAIFLKGMQEFQILMEKQLFGEAEKKLLRLKKLCKENRLYTQEMVLKIEALALEKKLGAIWQGKPEEAFRRSMISFDEMESHVLLLKDMVQLHRLSRELSYLTHQSESEERHRKIREKMNHPLLGPDREHDIDFQYVCALKSIGQVSSGDMEGAYETNRKLVGYYAELEASRKMRENEAYNFLSSINNFLYVCVYLHRYDEFDYWVERAKLLLNYNQSLANILAYIYAQEILSFRLRGMFEIVTAMEQTVMKFIKSNKLYGTLISQLLCMDFAINQMVIGNIEIGLGKINDLGKDTGYFEQSYPGLLAIIKAMCWYELGEYDQIRSWLKAQKKEPPKNVLQSAFMEAFSQVVAKEYTNDKQIWKQCLEQVKKQTIPLSRMDRFPTQEWLESRMILCTMAEVHRKNERYSSIF